MTGKQIRELERVYTLSQEVRNVIEEAAGVRNLVNGWTDAPWPDDSEREFLDSVSIPMESIRGSLDDVLETIQTQRVKLSSR
jgi:hypothetical protein